MDDFRKLFYGVLIAFVGVLVVWVSIVYISACGFSFTCQQGRPVVYSTPIPTLAAATLPAPDFSVQSPTVNRCRVAAVNLIGAWVSSGHPETDVFTFTDIDGLTCEATYGEDVEPLFLESNLWYPGSLSCASCHNADLTVSSAQMDMTTYAGLLAGSRRTSANVKGNDVLGGGDWEASLMYDVLYVRKYMPLGRPPEVPAEGPVIFAGTATQDGAQ
ncbi:MAG: hypothetical protein JW963_19425 [Anaerolineales bacterium]|nr:hypothetical protein [Anaerolineales bacterium]